MARWFAKTIKNKQSTFVDYFRIIFTTQIFCFIFIQWKSIIIIIIIDIFRLDRSFIRRQFSSASDLKWLAKELFLITITINCIYLVCCLSFFHSFFFSILLFISQAVFDQLGLLHAYKCSMLVLGSFLFVFYKVIVHRNYNIYHRLI